MNVNPRVLVCCERCGVKFSARPSAQRRFCGRTCSDEAQRADGNPRWRGGQTALIGSGYRMAYAPNHPKAVRGRVTEHVLVAERALGRYLPAGAEVHHVNEIRNDNRGANLVVCQDRDYHVLLHARAAISRAGGRPGVSKRCRLCRAVKPLADFYIDRYAHDGQRSACKPCDLAAAAEWRKARNGSHNRATAGATRSA